MKGNILILSTIVCGNGERLGSNRDGESIWKRKCGHGALSRMGGRDGEESTTKPGMPNATFMQQILT